MRVDLEHGGCNGVQEGALQRFGTHMGCHVRELVQNPLQPRLDVLRGSRAILRSDRNLIYREAGLPRTGQEAFRNHAVSESEPGPHVDPLPHRPSGQRQGAGPGDNRRWPQGRRWRSAGPAAPSPALDGLRSQPGAAALPRGRRHLARAYRAGSRGEAWTRRARSGSRRLQQPPRGVATASWPAATRAPPRTPAGLAVGPASGPASVPRLARRAAWRRPSCRS